jgi:hypothetical protein
MPRRKTHEQFVQEVYDLVGDEYTVLEQYQKSNIKIKFRHNNSSCDYYEFYMQPNSFLSGIRCPKCARKVTADKNRKTHERFVKEVYELVNNEYTVLGQYIKSSIKIKFRHNNESCNYHEFDMRPNDFLNGCRCPKCFKKEKKTTDEFKLEVLALVGSEYSVIGEYKNAHTKIEMIHNNPSCGNHRFYMSPHEFLKGQRCPKCYGNEKKTTEQFKREVYDLTNGEYEVLGVYINNKHKILMRHNNESCQNYEFSVSPNNFLRGVRCPACNESKGEKRISTFLNLHHIDYIEQYSFDDLRSSSGKLLRFDFAVFDKNKKLKLLIEYDGQLHYMIVDYFGGKEKLEKTKYYDSLKNQYCKQNNIPLLRIPYWEFDNIETILSKHLSTILPKSKGA